MMTLADADDEEELKRTVANRSEQSGDDAKDETQRLRQHVENQFNAVQSKVEIEDGAGSKVESAESAASNINK